VALLIVWQMRKVFQDWKNSCVRTDFMVSCWVIWTLLSSWSYYNAYTRYKDEYTRYCSQEEAHNLNNCSETLKNRRLESGKSQREVMASHNTGSSTVHDIKKWKY
jgi:hypothetical protein